MKLIGQSRDKRRGMGRWVNLYHMNYAWRLNWQHCLYDYQKSQRQYVPWKLVSESPSLMYILFTVISRLRSFKAINQNLLLHNVPGNAWYFDSGFVSRVFEMFSAFTAQCLQCIIKVKKGDYYRHPALQTAWKKLCAAMCYE